MAKARRIFGLNTGHHSRGDQADQAAAEDHGTTDASTPLRPLRHSGESMTRKALHGVTRELAPLRNGTVTKLIEGGLGSQLARVI